MLTSLCSLFYFTGECYRFLHRGWAKSCSKYEKLPKSCWGTCEAEKPYQGPFTWKEDDRSTWIILDGSSGLHAETRLLGSTFHLVYMQDRPSRFVFGWLPSSLSFWQSSNTFWPVRTPLDRRKTRKVTHARWLSTLGPAFCKQHWPCTLHIFNIVVFFVGQRYSKSSAFWDF